MEQTQPPETAGGARGKREDYWVSKFDRFHPRGNMNVVTRFHSDPAGRSGGVPLKRGPSTAGLLLGECKQNTGL